MEFLREIFPNEAKDLAPLNSFAPASLDSKRPTFVFPLFQGEMQQLVFSLLDF